MFLHLYWLCFFAPIVYSTLDLSGFFNQSSREEIEINYVKENSKLFDKMFLYVEDNKETIESELETHGEFYYPMDIDTDLVHDALTAKNPLKVLVDASTDSQFTELSEAVGDNVYTHFLYREKRSSTTNLERKLVIENFGRERNQYKSYAVFLAMP